MYQLKLCKKTSFLNIQDMVLNITYSACQILAFWPNKKWHVNPLPAEPLMTKWFSLFDSLRPSQQFFSYMYVLGLNQY